MYSLMKYSDNTSKALERFFQCHKDRSALGTNNNAIIEFADSNTSDSFKLEEKKDQSGNNGTKNVEIGYQMIQL